MRPLFQSIFGEPSPACGLRRRAVSGPWRWLEQLRAAVIDARRHPRRPGGRGGAVLTAGGRDHRVRLIDLSDEGAMVAADLDLPAGTEVKLQILDREPLDGQVRWSRDGRIGLRFGADGEPPVEDQDGQ